MESAGFKEWAIVCEALGRGEQSIILRKGGIAEGRTGFVFQHAEFFLFPTFFHEQMAKTRVADQEPPRSRSGEVEIKFFAKLDFSLVVTSWETAEALEPFHIWQREVVRERFEYDASPGIHLGVVRIFRLPSPWILPELPAYGGCRSWVGLPDYRDMGSLEPVLSDRDHTERVERIKAIASTAPIAK